MRRAVLIMVQVSSGKEGTTSGRDNEWWGTFYGPAEWAVKLADLTLPVATSASLKTTLFKLAPVLFVEVLRRNTLILILILSLRYTGPDRLASTAKSSAGTGRRIGQFPRESPACSSRSVEEGMQMRMRIPTISGAVTVVAVMVVGMAVVGAQAPSGTASVQNPFNTDAAIKAAVEAARAAAAVKNWTMPRTPWGDPDLQGHWLLATYTPLERPAELANKPFFTEAEAIAAFKKAVEADAEVDPRTVHYDWKEYGMDAWQAGATPNLRTSLIVEPADGRLPPWTPEALKRRAAAAAAARVRNPAAGVRTFGNLYTRCILGLYGAPLVRGGEPGATAASAAAGVSAESQLVQTPGYVVIMLQTNSEVRVIPLDGRPHLSEDIRQWLGDPRGRWEGNTLVVETTNFNELSHSRNFQGATSALRLVERFTRVGPNTLKYEYTVTDPNTWTTPWSGEAPLPRVDPPLYEFACHEQNYGLINVVTGTQISEGTRKAR